MPYVRYSSLRISLCIASLRISNFKFCVSKNFHPNIFRSSSGSLQSENTAETTSDHFLQFFLTNFFIDMSVLGQCEPISNDFNYMSVDTQIKCAEFNCVDFNFILVFHNKSHFNFSVLAFFTANNDVIIVRFLNIKYFNKMN